MVWEEEVAARRTKAAVVATRRELKGRPAKSNNIEGIVPITIVGGASYGVVWWVKHGRREYGRQLQKARKGAASWVRRTWSAFVSKVTGGKKSGRSNSKPIASSRKAVSTRDAAADAAEKRQRQAASAPNQGLAPSAAGSSTASAPEPAQAASPQKVAPPASGPTKSKKKKKGKKKK
uniref:Uncharacterized protein n=1 Tax=Tetraselmis chuii TaxID=63592 RepID=A0A7S1T126_9CHLO|mmetsp:Transcript_39068/g.69972  ORF Transcript_39068/g.69972 Transcript_39068/m.69972 type:complete len:177 (+) Transcript_39068:208-738(+)|eukprot:CAMPEP_0177772894 /NCGR_PEP_ID=MMETSP0491_2-20121128/12527_1 /TAXON_ID=63592 /ORGANISM="Tetraselmis chuii, Strain PLY429" /LENGTH=176 /DNA_ID=CAMNT_0019290857 /DNA_START=169 /DNA_END=699 /DNA_ORIENTATION=-